MENLGSLARNRLSADNISLPNSWKLRLRARKQRKSRLRLPTVILPSLTALASLQSGGSLLEPRSRELHQGKSGDAVMSDRVTVCDGISNNFFAVSSS